MRTMKVFVLTSMMRVNEDTELKVVGVYSTKTQAKEKLAEWKRATIEHFEDNDSNDYMVCDDAPTIFGITCNNKDKWSELQVTEKVIDND